jgi:hypothetical protein
MSTKLVTNKVRIRDPKKVRASLDPRQMDGIKFRVRKQGTGYVLDAAFKTWDPTDWQAPVAVRLDQLPAREGYADEEAWLEAADEVLSAKGREGFLALLRELAPHLEAELLILSASRGEGRCWAEVWCVRPGAKEVQTLRTGAGP